jgi:hypothetical protein
MRNTGPDTYSFSLSSSVTGGKKCRKIGSVTTPDIKSTIQKIRKLHIQSRTPELTPAKRIEIEGLWTDALLELLRVGNVDILKNFRYRLEMDEENDHEEISPK